MGGHADLVAVVGEGGGAGGVEDGGDERAMRLVVGVRVAEAVPAAGIVVIVEDEQGLVGRGAGFHLGDGLAEVGRLSWTLWLSVRPLPSVWKPTRMSMGSWSSGCGGRAVPLVQLGGVGEVGLADEDAVAGIFVDHRAHAAEDVVDFGEAAGVDVVELGSPWALRPAGGGSSRSWGSSKSVVMASRRKPATPRSSQKRMASNMAFSTAGLRQLRSGCCL